MTHFPIRAALLGAALLALTSGAAQAQALHGRVVALDDGLGVPFATVVDEGTGRGVAADVDGHFSFGAPRPRAVRVTAVGFGSERASVPDAGDVLVTLRPVAVGSDEVVVEAAGASSEWTAPSDVGSTDDLLTRLPGLDLVQRGAFAWEPAVRGLSGAQIGLTIDGMRVYGACVDKMDPASSYVEPENLARVDVSRGAFNLATNPGIGGSIDLVTAEPAFDTPVTAQAEVGAESGSAVRRARAAVGASAGAFAVRLSGSYRGAGDYAPGGGPAIAHSGYDKRNGSVALAWRPARGHAVTARALADDAWLVGYPALLMDATLASARLYSLGWETEGAAARVYRSRVDHTMDDRFRDVRTREVMRGMYMPMGGYTDTYGLVGDARRPFGRTTGTLAVDLHRTGQFGDMTMLSVFPGIPEMVLLNVGDARATNLGVTLGAERAVGPAAVRAEARVDATWRDVHMAEARSLFADAPGGTARRLAAPSVSVVAEAPVGRGLRARLGLARAARLPSLTEHYGHYVYTYTDGYFYSGDPALRPETSLQAEAGLEHVGPNHALRATAFVNRIGDHIAGVPDASLTASGAYRFRRFANVGWARLWGGEASALVRLGGRTEAVASVSATFGHRHDVHEGMAKVPPVRGLVVVRHRPSWFGGRTWAELEDRWAAPQNRVAAIAAEETPTDGYTVLALRVGAALGGGAEARIGVENALDTYYREHTAVGGLPARGRAFTASVSVGL